MESVLGMLSPPHTHPTSPLPSLLFKNKIQSSIHSQKPYGLHSDAFERPSNCAVDFSISAPSPPPRCCLREDFLSLSLASNILWCLRSFFLIFLAKGRRSTSNALKLHLAPFSLWHWAFFFFFFWIGVDSQLGHCILAQVLWRVQRASLLHSSAFIFLSA